MRTAATGKRSARTTTGSALVSTTFFTTRRRPAGNDASTGSDASLTETGATMATSPLTSTSSSPPRPAAEMSMSSDPASVSSQGRANAASPASSTRPRSAACTSSPRLSPDSSTTPALLRSRAGPSVSPSPARARSTISFSARTSIAPAGLPRTGGDDSDTASSDSRPSAVAGLPGAMRATAVPETMPRGTSFPGSGGKNGSIGTFASVSVTSPSRPEGLGARRPSTAIESISQPRARTAPFASGVILIVPPPSARPP